MRDLTGGYDIVAAADGAAALAQIEQRLVRLLITDYHLPRMNGLELARTVRRISPDTRIALITGYATDQLASDATAAGITYYLPKPFKLDDLEAIVRAALT
jgi:CheY-like chemotaxis protein